MSTTPDNAPGSARKKVRRGVWIAFGVSLALNLFLIGFLVARVTGPHGGGHGDHWRGDPTRGMSRSMSEDGRAILRQGFREHRDDLRQAHMAARAAQRQVNDLLAAPDLDPQALEAAFDTLRAARRNVEEAWQGVMLAAAVQLNQQDRQALAARQHHGQRFGGPRHPDRPERPSPSDEEMPPLP